MDERHQLGRTGEDLAAGHLEKIGYKVIKRNFTNSIGELDIVAMDGSTVVVVEVKTRSKAGRAPSEAVDFRKQRKLVMTTAMFLKSQQWHERPIRFDVVEVIKTTGGSPIIRHIKSAFDASVW